MWNGRIITVNKFEGMWKKWMEKVKVKVVAVLN
jgi:hypothetical protein